MDHCKKHQQELNKRLRGCYNDIEKSNEDELQKGGEGSKGGKVIGHTQSGKAVYESNKAKHKVYKDFSQKDHYDAAIIHHHSSKENRQSLDRSLELRTSAYYHHKEKANDHIEAMKHKDYFSTEQLVKEFLRKIRKLDYIHLKKRLLNSFLNRLKRTDGTIGVTLKKK